MSTLSIHNFTFTPQTLTVKAGTKVTWINKDDIPHGIASSNNAFKKSGALTPMTATPSPSLRRGPISTSVIYIPTWWARSSWKQQLAASPRSNATIGCINMDRSWTAGHDTMANGADAEKEKMRRFRDGALPHLDDLYTLASYLMRNATDAEDVVQEWGPAMKPWLLAILRNVCNAEFARRARGEVPTDYAQDESVAKEMPTWQEPHTSPDKMILQQQDSAAIRQLVTELPEPFREAIVLREINELSYKEIAEVAGVPVARARAVLRFAWNAAETVTVLPGSAAARGTAPRNMTGSIASLPSAPATPRRWADL
jgi:RNA polymerase sigma-70 factor, ECF subfamily